MHTLLRSRVNWSQSPRLSPSPAASKVPSVTNVRFSRSAVIFSCSLGASSLCPEVGLVGLVTRAPAWNLSCGRRRPEIVCMATDRRVRMVSQQIKREISEMLIYDKVLHATVLPETALGADMYLTSVATISDVEMSKDLSVAKVYISIYGDDRGQEKALTALKQKAGYVRKGLARRMNLKFTPEVRFIKDEALERGSRVIGILDELKREREAKAKKELQEEDVELDDDDVQEHEESQGLNGSEEVSTISQPSTDEGDDSEEPDDLNIIYIQ